ncbi:MAG: glycosyltransferase family 4 protein [Alphaproteobacteria bacterium]|nr:glycosyltransferase family 4 protein [Alphaproteobacteria bacterium]
MRIAQISPLHESVPPQRYGGTERIVSYLTEELVRLGHDVTLFASADSVTSAKLVAGARTSLRTSDWCRDPLALHLAMIEDVGRRAAEFDIIHSHIEYLPLPVLSRVATPYLTTLHGRLDFADYGAVLGRFHASPFVSLTMEQRRPLPDLNWAANINHGLPPGLLDFAAGPGDYLAFLGRAAPEKGLDSAIRIALEVGMPLKIGAKVDIVDKAYFEQVVAPLLDHPDIEFLGEIGGKLKQDLLGGAAALLFPIDWPEPFGLVMIEAMACGTPVIARRRGSVSEVVQHGLTGYVVETEAEAAAAIGRLDRIDRRAVRAEFDRRFTANRMTRQYLALYKHLAEARRPVVLAAD